MAGRDNPTLAPRSRRPNISDLAARTGLSTATISRAINGKPWVAAPTRARVLAALEDLGYVPSRLAAGLRTGRTNQLGLMIGPQLDPTTMATMQGALQAAASAQYGMVVYLAHERRERERIFSEVLADGGIDGALLLYPSTADESFVRRLCKGGLPLVLIDPQTELSGVPSVYADTFRDGYTSARHLLDLGHRHIGLCADDFYWGVDSRYLDGYRAALAEAGVAMGPALGRGLVTGYSYEEGYEIATSWLHLPSPPTGMCFHCDMAAMGAIAAARDHGLQVPDDLSVIGYDDVQMAEWIRPSLTTLRERRVGLARAACDVLLDLVNGSEPPSEPVLIQTDLAVRQSTGPAR